MTRTRLSLTRTRSLSRLALTAAQGAAPESESRAERRRATVTGRLRLDGPQAPQALAGGGDRETTVTSSLVTHHVPSHDDNI
jgi:hypothetical protein